MLILQQCAEKYDINLKLCVFLIEADKYIQVSKESLCPI